MLNELNVGGDSSIIDKADAILGEYAGNSQAGFASLIKAKALVELGAIADAKAVLQLVIDKPLVEGIDELARLRLARLLVIESNYDDALLLVNGGGKAFEAHYQELRGDIYFAQGRVEKAREAYQGALADPAALASSQELRMKLDSLGEADDANLEGENS